MGKYKPKFNNAEILNWISRNPGCTTKQLEEKFELTRQGVHHRMKKLTKKGFLLIAVGRGKVQSRYTVTNHQPWRARLRDK
jgi:predicted HTH transcriptional regulator